MALARSARTHFGFRTVPARLERAYFRSQRELSGAEGLNPGLRGSLKKLAKKDKFSWGGGEKRNPLGRGQVGSRILFARFLDAPLDIIKKKTIGTVIANCEENTCAQNIHHQTYLYIVVSGIRHFL